MYICLFFLSYLIFGEISSTSNSPRFNLSVHSKFHCFHQILYKYSVILYLSPKQHSILQQKFPLHYVDLYLETVKVCPLCLQLASNPVGYFCGRIFLQPLECGGRLIMVTNQPVPRPSTTVSACSQSTHFFFSTSRK